MKQLEKPADRSQQVFHNYLEGTMPRGAEQTLFQNIFRKGYRKE